MMELRGSATSSAPEKGTKMTDSNLNSTSTPTLNEMLYFTALAPEVWFALDETRKQMWLAHWETIRGFSGMSAEVFAAQTRAVRDMWKNRYIASGGVTP
ncbi:hypothetical protein [Methylosinus sp. KRF6]|uniref:hypothetical protein n=1 Tax=Methylosinus sp. KRF6 TaxID=2846853 RepID=UPI001C0BE8E8|nr:hypothetical protein [Methylosinus sp. KRF6]MBU3887586.1 hypothetical protein [Methylosinus sp. KRF6]